MNFFLLQTSIKQIIFTYKLRYFKDFYPINFDKTVLFSLFFRVHPLVPFFRTKPGLRTGISIPEFRYNLRACILILFFNP